MKLLRDYCLAKELDVEFENLPVSELCTLLKGFYINLRRHNGELYTRSSFLVVRQSLNRFLRNPPVSKSFDIMADSTFNNANDAVVPQGHRWCSTDGEADPEDERASFRICRQSKT